MQYFFHGIRLAIIYTSDFVNTTEGPFSEFAFDNELIEPTFGLHSNYKRGAINGIILNAVRLSILLE